jgi:soluble lytic murein transglycosylase-like protein
MKRTLFLLTAISIFFTFQTLLFGQAYYTYTDENGIQNITNIPPARPVADLKISGKPEPVATSAAPTTTTKSKNYDPIIEKVATQHQIDPSLIRSIIAQESGFNPKAVSAKGARGLMQLMPATAERLGVKNSFDPEQNIQGGVKHFRFLMDSFNNNLELSLAAYNAGENLVQRLGRIPAIRETQDYVQSITTRYGKKQAPAKEPEAPKHPPIFRYVDDGGIQNWTNIPPQNANYRIQDSNIRSQN